MQYMYLATIRDFTTNRLLKRIPFVLPRDISESGYLEIVDSIRSSLVQQESAKTSERMNRGLGTPYHCNDCAYMWRQRLARAPKRCPKCFGKHIEPMTAEIDESAIIAELP